MRDRAQAIVLAYRSGRFEEVGDTVTQHRPGAGAS